MRYWISLLALGIFACGSLTQEKPVADVGISFERKTFLRESSAGCKKDQPCAKYQISYPVFSGLDSAIQNKIQREIELSLSLGDPEAETKTLAQVAQEFIDNYTEFNKEMPESMGWYYSGEVNVNLLTDTLLSLIIQTEYFTGGAHGGSETYFVNMNPKTGDKITLDDVMKTGFLTPLTNQGEIEFRKERELADTATFRFNNFEFPGDKFQLNKNYGFNEHGIQFVFNSYEIGPYALGPTSIFIPYTSIKDWLK